MNDNKIKIFLFVVILFLNCKLCLSQTIKTSFLKIRDDNRIQSFQEIQKNLQLNQYYASLSLRYINVSGDKPTQQLNALYGCMSTPLTSKDNSSYILIVSENRILGKKDLQKIYCVSAIDLQDFPMLKSGMEIIFAIQMNLGTDEGNEKSEIISFRTNQLGKIYSLSLLGNKPSQIQAESSHNLINSKIQIRGFAQIIFTRPSRMILKFKEMNLITEYDLSKLRYELIFAEIKTSQEPTIVKEDSSINLVSSVSLSKADATSYQFDLSFSGSQFRELKDFQIYVYDDVENLIGQSDLITIDPQTQCTNKLQQFSSPSSPLADVSQDLQFQFNIETQLESDYTIFIHYASSMKMQATRNQIFVTMQIPGQSAEQKVLCNTYQIIQTMICQRALLKSQNVAGLVKLVVPFSKLVLPRTEAYRVMVSIQDSENSQTCSTSDPVEFLPAADVVTRIDMVFQQNSITLSINLEYPLNSEQTLTITMPQCLKLNPNPIITNQVNMSFNTLVTRLSLNSFQISNAVPKDLFAIPINTQISITITQFEIVQEYLANQNNWSIQSVYQGSILFESKPQQLKFEAQPLKIKKFEYVRGKDGSEGVTNIEFLIDSLYILNLDNYPKPAQSRSIISISLPPIYSYIQNNSQVKILYEGAFVDICEDQNEFSIKVKDDLNPSSLPKQQRVFIEISCKLSGKFYKNMNKSYIVSIKGMLLPRSLQISDRIIIELSEQDLGTQNIISLFQTSESSAFTQEQKDLWKFIPSNENVKFEEAKLIYPMKNPSDLTCLGGDNIIQTLFQLQTAAKILDGDVLRFTLNKESFQLLAKSNAIVQGNNQFYPNTIKIECRGHSISSQIDLKSVLTNCSFTETSNSYIFEALINPSQLSSSQPQWDQTNIILICENIMVLPYFSFSTPPFGKYELLDSSKLVVYTSNQVGLEQFLQVNQTWVKLCSMELVDIQLDKEKELSSTSSNNGASSEQLKIKELKLRFEMRVGIPEELRIEIKLDERMKMKRNNGQIGCYLDILPTLATDTNIACSLIITDKGINLLNFNSFRQSISLYSSQNYPLIFVIKMHEILVDPISSVDSPIVFKIDYRFYKVSRENQALTGSSTYKHELACAQKECSKCQNVETNCHLCSEGYFLDLETRKCTKQCKETASTDIISRSCLTCKTQPNICTQCKIDNLTICTKCADKYILSASGYCYLPLAPTPPTPTDPTPPKDDTKPSPNSLQTSQTIEQQSVFEKILGICREYLLSSVLVGASILTYFVKIALDLFQRKSKKDGQQQQRIVWVSGLLFLANIIDLTETPYIITSGFNTSNEFQTAETFLQVEKSSSLIYLGMNLCVYVYCLIILLKVMVLDDSSTSVFYLFQQNDPSSQLLSPESNRNNTNNNINANTNEINIERNKESYTELSPVKAGINLFVRCLVAALGKCFCILYLNIGRKSNGWLNCDIYHQYGLFKVISKVLSLHAILHILGSIWFAVIVTNLEYITFSLCIDLIVFKFSMALICFANYTKVQSLLKQQ
uniref:MTBp n=1 Tax=Tetrahymena shanghaiensis TaxID=175566 RepID=A0A513X5B3_9HYMN|nr:MTBp [Tetrahymena shanghaiensis]